MRTRIGLAAIFALVALTGCTATGPNNSPAPVESATNDSAATAAPTSSPTSAPAAEAEFTDSLLVDLCVEKTTQDHGGSPEFKKDHATVEAIEADPPWLVIVPATSAVGDAISYCTIGGTPAAPVYELHGAADPSMEAEIRSWATS